MVFSVVHISREEEIQVAEMGIRAKRKGAVTVYFPASQPDTKPIRTIGLRNLDQVKNEKVDGSRSVF